MQPSPSRVRPSCRSYCSLLRSSCDRDLSHSEDYPTGRRLDKMSCIIACGNLTICWWSRDESWQWQSASKWTIFPLDSRQAECDALWWLDCRQTRIHLRLYSIYSAATISVTQRSSKIMRSNISLQQYTGYCGINVTVSTMHGRLLKLKPWL